MNNFAFPANLTILNSPYGVDRIKQREEEGYTLIRVEFINAQSGNDVIYLWVSGNMSPEDAFVDAVGRKKEDILDTEVTEVTKRFLAVNY